MTSLRRYVRDLRRAPPIDWDVAEKVVMMIEAGTPISAIGDIAGMPPYWVVHSWRKESQEFDELITVASEAKAAIPVLTELLSDPEADVRLAAADLAVDRYRVSFTLAFLVDLAQLDAARIGVVAIESDHLLQ